MAKLSTSVATYAVADRQDGLEVVVLDLLRNLPFSFSSNYPEFPDGCLTGQRDTDEGRADQGPWHGGCCPVCSRSLRLQR